MKARAPSLRWRLLAATVVVLLLALLPAGMLIGALFREHVTVQFREGLQVHLDQLAAATQFGPDGTPQVESTRLSDPRWQRPFSGLYWQVDGPGNPGVQRSRSLWDSMLPGSPAVPADGRVHARDAVGPQGQPLLLLVRSIHDAARPGASWNLMVAAGTAGLEAAVARFRTQLGLSLLVLFTLLALASWVEVAVGLAPLRRLAAALEALRAGRSTRLDGRFPREVQPLVDDFNAVLAHDAEMVERARKHAGNLAHALKTPLTVLQQAADQLATGKVQAAAAAQVMTQQLATARRQVDWHLARARTAAQLRIGAQATELVPVLQGLVRVLERVHAARRVHIDVQVPPGLRFAGEEQDLHEMLGNLLDNACKWARSRVVVSAGPAAHAGRSFLLVSVEDDGAGIEQAALAQLPSRGRRLDETRPGAGLGLAIVQDLADAYGGRLELGPSQRGGLAARVLLPAA